MYTSDCSHFVIIRGVQRRDYTHRNNRRKKIKKKSVKVTSRHIDSIDRDRRNFLCRINIHNAIISSEFRY